jgi:single-strand DNA-binding protein
MNKVFLHGRLTKDLELRYTQNGVANATFTLAVNRRFKKENEERQADFINCVVWQKPAENAANMIGKGCRVDVIGRWETRNYEGQDGRRVYVNECIVEEMTFIDFADREGRNNTQNNQSNTNASQGNQNANSGQNKGYTRMDDDPFAGNGQIDIADDDLPF